MESENLAGRMKDFAAINICIFCVMTAAHILERKRGHFNRVILAAGAGAGHFGVNRDDVGDKGGKGICGVAVEVGLDPLEHDVFKGLDVRGEVKALRHFQQLSF